MAATTISVRWRGRAGSFVRLLTATVLLAAIGACGGAGVPDDAPPADGVPARSAAGLAAAAGSPDGSPADEPPSSDRVILNGEELSPDLAAAFRQATQELQVLGIDGTSESADLAAAFREAMQERTRLSTDVAERPLPDGVAGARAGQRRPNASGASSTDDVEPDWTAVAEYLDQQRAWMESNRPRSRPSRDVSSEERVRAMTDRLAERPDVSRAAAAAKAILEQEGAHEKTVEAAEFLVLRVQSGGSVAQNMVAGATGLLRHAPDYEGWPQVLGAMEGRSFLGPEIGAFFEEMASGAEDSALRATGRYYVAAGLTQAANGSPFGLLSGWTSLSANLAESEAKRQSALEAAAGLSAGVEEERFLGMLPDGRASEMTLAEAEADLVRSIRHGTVGGALPEVTGTRIDGVEESLSDYRGRVVLLDFWATWCVPCIDVLPDLRKLVEELPADRFALVAISVDEELETVTRFMEDEPMPWTNWHAGLGSDIARLLRVQAYPTYVLVDESGRILARPRGRFQEIALPPGAPADSFPGVPPTLPDLIREALAGLPPA